jgi:hypothetical protein
MEERLVYVSKNYAAPGGRFTSATKCLIMERDATERQKDIPQKSVYIQFECPFG